MLKVNWLRQMMDCLLVLKAMKMPEDLVSLERCCIVSMKDFAYADQVFLVKKEDARVSQILSYQDNLPHISFLDNNLISCFYGLEEVSVLQDCSLLNLDHLGLDTAMLTIIPVKNEFFEGVYILSYKEYWDYPADYLNFISIAQMEIHDLYLKYYGSQRLEEYQIRFKGILQTVSQSIVFIDNNGQYCWLNKNAAQLLDLPEDNPVPEIVRKAMFKLRDTAVNKKDIEANADGLFSGENNRLFYWKYESPEERVLKVNFTAIKSAGFSGAMWVFDDVTQEQEHERQLERLNKKLENKSQQAEESNQRYQYVLKATSDAIFDWDLINGTLYWGEGYETLFGYRIADLPSETNAWMKHIHPDHLTHITARIKEFLESSANIWSEEYLYRRADDSYSHISSKGFILRDENHKAIRFVGAMRDISERVKAESESKAFADDLFKRNKELQQFGYIISHNLRAPVANIMGMTNLLEMDQEDAEHVKNYIKGLQTAVGNLDNVIKDLSKILSTNDNAVILPRELVNLDEILINVKTDLAELISHNDAIIVSPNETHHIITHKAYVYSVFYNLISNAIKYRSEKTPVVTIAVTMRESASVVTIADNGIGIDLEKHREELCKPYKRFNTEVKGKGLGLFLVKSHVEAIGGDFIVDSHPGEGTTFTIVLPSS